MTAIKHILVATDGSEGSREAASLAGNLAKSCGAKISVVAVNDDDALTLPALIEAALPDTTPYTAFPKNDMRKIIEQQTEADVLSPTVEALGQTDTAAETAQLWGHAAKEICDFAAENAVDLIVIGRRGNSQFKQLFLGSVSSQVVSHAPCAVLVAK
ncbi:MAG: universal stress protein [Gammaproteobacteria bacterium]